MSGKSKNSVIALHAEEAIENPFFPRRSARRAHEHRLIALATLSGIALGALALFPATVPTLVTAVQPSVKEAEVIRDSGKSARLPSPTAPIAALESRHWG